MVVITVALALANSSKSTRGASTNVLWYAFESVVALLTTLKRSALAGELTHSHGWKRSRVMVGCLVVVYLVNGDSGVDDVGLDSLLLHNRLDSLMDVVVDMLATDGGRRTLAVGGGINLPLVFEASLLLDKVPLCRIVVAVIELSVLDGTKLGSVLLGEHLTVLNRLNGAVVVVLMNLLVDSCLNLLVLVGLDHLVSDSGSNRLMDGSVVVTRLGHEVRDGCLGLFHDDWRLVFGVWCLVVVVCWTELD